MPPLRQRPERRGILVVHSRIAAEEFKEIMFGEQSPRRLSFGGSPKRTLPLKADCGLREGIIGLRIPHDTRGAASTNLDRPAALLRQAVHSWSPHLGVPHS